MGEAMPTCIVQINGSNQVEIIGSKGGNIRRDGKGAVSVEWQLNSANPAFEPTIYCKHAVGVENSGAAKLDPVIVIEQ